MDVHHATERHIHVRKWYDPKLGLHTRLTRVLPEPLVILLYAVFIGVVGGYGAVGLWIGEQGIDFLGMHH